MSTNFEEMYSSQESRGERIKETLQRILIGHPPSRIERLVKVFHKVGCISGDDLKYFDREALIELQTLEGIEIVKIMTFIRRNYPEEYEEHKRKQDEMSKLKHEIKQIEKATEFHNKKSDLQREEAMIKQQFEERKEIMDDISRLTGEYVALNNKKFKDCLKGKKTLEEISKFMKRKDDSKKLLEKVEARNLELDRKEVQLGRFLKE